jgi:hypothetical protein
MMTADQFAQEGNRANAILQFRTAIRLNPPLPGSKMNGRNLRNLARQTISVKQSMLHGRFSRIDGLTQTLKSSKISMISFEKCFFSPYRLADTIP